MRRLNLMWSIVEEKKGLRKRIQAKEVEKNLRRKKNEKKMTKKKNKH